MNAKSIAIVCHAHFLDADLFMYPIFQRRSPGFEALVGDYGAPAPTLSSRRLLE